MVLIAVPAIWWKNSAIKRKWLFFKTSFKASRIKDLLNLEWINSGYLSNQYTIAFNPSSCIILVHKLVTSKDISFKYFIKFLLLFLRNSKLSFTELLILDKTGLMRVLTKLLRCLADHLWPATLGYNFESFRWKQEIYSEPSSSIGLEAILDFWF